MNLLSNYNLLKKSADRVASSIPANIEPKHYGFGMT